MELILGVVGVAVALALVVIAVGFQFDERASIRSSLRRLGGYDIQDTRDQELLNPLRDRAVTPVLRGLVDFGRRVTPVGYLDSVRRKHVQAGKAGPEYVDQYIVVQILALFLVPIGWFVAFQLLDLEVTLSFAVWGLIAAIGLLGPTAVLDRQVEERTHAVRIALPDILDLLVISVEAGLGFEQALDRVISTVPGPLTDEFTRMTNEVRAGSTRSEAMRAMESRLDVPEVRSFILAMLQADTFGVSIGRVLRTQADEMRVRRRQLAQEMAQKAPVKMLVPMVFCIFPALFLVVIGPAVLDILDNF